MTQEEEVFIRAHPFIRSLTTRYQTIFFGLCYACNNFGHEAPNCRANDAGASPIHQASQRMEQGGDSWTAPALKF